MTLFDTFSTSLLDLHGCVCAHDQLQTPLRSILSQVNPALHRRRCRAHGAGLWRCVRSTNSHQRLAIPTWSSALHNAEPCPHRSGACPHMITCKRGATWKTAIRSSLIIFVTRLHSGSDAHKTKADHMKQSEWFCICIDHWHVNMVPVRANCISGSINCIEVAWTTPSVSVPGCFSPAWGGIAFGIW